uniref:Uncharacterized protein n=1 Tax=Alexandrium catenella TaxID=2925 RepID=A0A7S1LCE8_ALECA
MPTLPTPGAPEPEVIGKADSWGGLAREDTETEGEPLLPPRTPLGGDENGGSSVEELRRALAEIRARNSELQKRLDARPIVYQFAPGDGADCTDLSMEDLGRGDIEDSTADEAGGAAGPNGSSSSGAGLQRWARRASRHAVRGAKRLRRQRHVRCVEQWLRRATLRLLQEPLLLWLFYVHVVILWVAELRHQASPRPAPLCP